VRRVELVTEIVLIRVSSPMVLGPDRRPPRRAWPRRSGGNPPVIVFGIGQGRCLSPLATADTTGVARTGARRRSSSNHAGLPGVQPAIPFLSPFCGCTPTRRKERDLAAIGVCGVWRDPDSNRGHHDFQPWGRSPLTRAKRPQISAFQAPCSIASMCANCGCLVWLWAPRFASAPKRQGVGQSAVARMTSAWMTAGRVATRPRRQTRVPQCTRAWLSSRERPWCRPSMIDQNREQRNGFVAHGPARLSPIRHHSPPPAARARGRSAQSAAFIPVREMAAPSSPDGRRPGVVLALGSDRSPGRQAVARAGRGSSRSTRLSRTALVATMIELTDISSADHSGRSSMPADGKRTPAAIGIAMTL